MVTSLDRLARDLTDLRETVRDLSGTPQLAHAAIVDGAIEQVETYDTGEVDALGNPIYGERLVARFGQQLDGSNTVNSVTGPIPPRPVGHVVTAGPGFISVEWFGAFENAIDAYLDHDYIAVHVGTTSDFTPIADTQKATIRSTAGEKVTIAVDAGTYYVKLVAVSTVPNYSAPSTYAQGAPGTVDAVDVTARQLAEEAKNQAQQAAAAAAAAQATANGKNHVFRQATAPASGGLVAGDLWVESDADNKLWSWDGSTWVAAPLGTTAIQAGSVTAALLASQIVLSSTIIAGPTNAAHAQLDTNGLTIFGTNPDFDPAQPESADNPRTIVTSRMGSSSDTDFFQVFNPSSGEVVAAISQLGGLSAATANLGDSPGDVNINGAPFESYFDQNTRGLVDWGKRTTNGASSSSEIAYLEVQTYLTAGRTYRIATSSYYAALGTNSALVGVLRMATGGAAVTTTSTQIDSCRVIGPTGTGTPKSPALEAYISLADTDTSQEYRFLMSYYYTGTSGFITASSGYPVTLTVTDLGPYREETGIDRSAPPASGTKKNYVTTWVANATGTYTGSGSKRTDTTDMVQGYNSSNGNQFGLSIFTAANGVSNYSEDTGKTIASALTSATVTKVEVYLYFYHWYYNSGGTAFLTTGAETAIPSSMSAITSGWTLSSSWPKPGGRWVTLPKTATARSVRVGQPNSTSLTYYGRAYGAAGSYKPQIRISYTR